MNAAEWPVRTAADRLALEQGCYWDQESADRIIRFAEGLFRTQTKKGPLRLLDWQRRFLMQVYGWKNADHSRRIRNVCLHIAKKNGKTLLVSIIALYEMFAAGVYSPFVASGSTTKKNASQVFDSIKFALDHSPLGGFADATKSKKEVLIPSNNGKYWALSSDTGGGNQGWDLSCCILDEMHSMPVRENSLYDAVRYSTKARRGLFLTISTAGNDVCHPYFEIYTKAKRVIAGEDLDITFYGEVYESDPDADPEDPAEWHKANPSLGTILSVEDFRLEIEAAKTSKTEWMRAMRYCLNRWVRPSELAFVDVQQFDRNAIQVPDHVLMGCPAYMFNDLSTSIDPSSSSICWVLPDGRYHLKSWAWVCQQGVVLREKQNLARYQEFIEAGSMTMTTGNMIDHTLILNWIRETAKRFKVKSIDFDSTNALIMMEKLQSEGFKVESKPQFPRFWNVPMREWERHLTDGRLTNDGSAWLRYCCGNVRIRVNDRNEISPAKAKSPDKIDGFISACGAFGDALMGQVQKPKPSIYNSKEAITV